MSRFAHLLAAAGVVVVATAFHVLWQPPALTLAFFFFALCTATMAAFVAISRGGGDFTHQEPAEGRIVCVIPSYNEDPWMLYGCIESVLNGSVVPDVIHVVDDGSTDPVPPYLHPRVVWHRQENTGKRQAQVNALVHELDTPTDFIVTVDSDSILDVDCLRECLRAMSDERVMAATATVTVLNRAMNILTRVTDLEIVYGCLVNRGARSFLGAVAPTAGTFAIYRAEIVFNNLEDYLASGTAGDDRRLTHYSLLKGRVVSVESAIVETTMPTTLGETFSQRTRWFKSYFRYLTWELRHLSGAPLLLRSWNLFLLVVFPVLIAWTLVVYPVRTGHIYWQAFPYWMALMYCQTLRYAVYARPGTTARERWLTWLLGTPMLTPLNMFVLRPAMYRAMTQSKTTHWQTRGDVVARETVGEGAVA